MNLLKFERHQKYKFLIPEFFRYNDSIDNIREESFGSIFPELE